MGVYVKNKLCYIIFQEQSILVVNNDIAKYYVFEDSPVLNCLLSALENNILTNDKLDRISKQLSENIDILFKVLNELIKLKIVFYVDETEEEFNINHITDERFSTEILYLNKFTSKPYQLLQAIQSKRVVIIGAGALGSSLALKISAIGVRDIICIDGDKIELDNLTRQILYTPGDIEKNLFKVSALESRIKDFFPSSQFQGIKSYITSYDDCVNYIPHNSDLIIQTADYPIGKLDDWINKVSLKYNIPVIFSHFGSVGPFLIPSETGCLRCLDQFLDTKTNGLNSITKNFFQNIPNSKSPSFVTGTQLNELLILDIIKKFWISDEYRDFYNKVYTFYDGFSDIKTLIFPTVENCICRRNYHE